MNYRPEIDGLRTVAVVSVILSHAEFSLFSGGFVGVDIFFVISGYLIATIIMNDLDAGRFSVVNFYERRARRILPALFLVMVVATPFAYLWMLPDEFKNYGQSLVATSMFSNNILLSITSDYWSLASEFKPFLHTWSLAVEEQYYVLFPLFMVFCWKYSRNYFIYLIAVLFTGSFGTAIWWVNHYPSTAFYILPTRGWELLAGAITAGRLNYLAKPLQKTIIIEAASLTGLAMLVFATISFDNSVRSPGPWILLPVIGSVLIIAFAVQGTLVNWLLSTRPTVAIGLISYSAYLWHQPLFALARVYKPDEISPTLYVMLILATIILAYLTWRFVEAPFRNKQAVSRPTIFAFSLAGTVCLSAFGVYLDRSYGMASRAFAGDINIQDVDKRIYNERVFKYKADVFSNDNRLKIFVVGNSFGRDFVNMTSETFNMENLEIVYQDQVNSCIVENSDRVAFNLFNSADIIVFASGYDSDDAVARNCVAKDIEWSAANQKSIFFVGSKDFGRNLNWVVRMPENKKANLYNLLPSSALDRENENSNNIPKEHYISLLSPVLNHGMIPITDEMGRMLSVDRKHVTKYGAIYFGKRSVQPSRYGELLNQAYRKKNAYSLRDTPS